MTYTTPPTFVAGDELAAADLNILGDDIVDLDGRVNGLTFSGVSLYRSSAQSIPNTTNTNITWTTESFDIGGWWSSGTKVIVPAGAVPAGYTTIAVDVSVSLRYVSNGTGTRRLRIMQNGAAVDGGDQSVSALSGETTIFDKTWTVIVEAADELEIDTYQSSGGALNMDVARVQVLRRAPVA